VSARLSARVRRARGPLAVAVLVLLAAVVLTVVGARADRGALDPDSVEPAGSAALAALLRDRGVTVVPADHPEALAALGPATTVLVTVPDRLRRADLAALARSGARIVLVAPGERALEALPRCSTRRTRRPRAGCPRPTRPASRTSTGRSTR
jgi:hypothetical protein